MTKSISSLLRWLLMAMVAAMPAATAVSLQVNTAGCGNGDDDPFTNVNVTISCSNNHTNRSKCMFGDVANISGTVEAIRSFANSEMTYKACVWNFCPQSTIRSAGTLCDDWLLPIEDQTCGDAGIYSIALIKRIPEAGIGNSLSWLVTLNFGVNETSCNQTNTSAAVSEVSPSFGSSRFERSKSGGGQRQRGGEGGRLFMSYSLMGAIFGTVFGTVLAARKSCNEPDEYDDDELFEERPFSFTELKDVACNA